MLVPGEAAILEAGIGPDAAASFGSATIAARRLARCEGGPPRRRPPTRLHAQSRALDPEQVRVATRPAAASHDAAMLGIGSRLVADRVAACYGEYLPRHARGRLADLGCGSVPLYGSYRTLVSSVTCVDWAHSPHARRHINVEADLGAVLPFADASFDTLILSDVLEHVAEPERLWREMARLLAPGGHAFVNVPFLYGIHEAPHDYYRYTEFALRRLAERAGLACACSSRSAAACTYWRICWPSISRGCLSSAGRSRSACRRW